VLSRLGVRFRAEGVSEVKEEGAVALDADLAVAPDIAVVRTSSGNVQDRPRLLGPIRQVCGAKDGHPLPAVNEHPVRAL
jgi:hypothetical protein